MRCASCALGNRSTPIASSAAAMTSGRRWTGSEPMWSSPSAIRSSRVPRRRSSRSWSGVPRSVVTGAAGFLGSHLSERLLAEGHRVIGVDNFLTGLPDNLRAIRKHPKFSLVRQDVTEDLKIPGKLDYVLHFASAASPVDYTKFGIQTLKANALGTHKTLGLAKAKKARYLLASSSEVYGDPDVNPQPETYWGHVDPVGPRSVYDEGKRFAEAMATAYHHGHGMEVRIARIFNTYGPRLRLDDGRVIPNFLGQVLRGEPLTIYGDGTQTRS